MELTLGWFPLLKFVVTLGFLYGVYYFYKSRRYKIMFWYVGLLTLFWVFAPIKYNGTNSSNNNIRTTSIRTQGYKDTIINNTKIKTKKLTFSEKMLLEEKRSALENTKTLNQIQENKYN